jgi:hypothetical protein
MHATRDTRDVIELRLAGGRVMRGVMSPLHVELMKSPAAPPLGDGKVEEIIERPVEG